MGMGMELTSAHISFIPIFSIWSIEFRLTLVTIDPFGIVLTIFAHTTTLISAMYVQ